jgi:parallel beta-helix repeat protein
MRTTTTALVCLLWVVATACVQAAAVQPATIPDTAYAPPATAIYVATTGNDANPGSAAAPVRSIARGYALAAAGSTIVLRSGEYRESLSLSGKPVTIQPYPHELAWMTGSVVVSGWVADGNGWRKDGWIHQFTKDTSSRYLDPAYPLAGWPDLAFIDGNPLRQVATRSALAAGCFFVDDAAHQLFIGDNPSGRKVEAAALGQAIYLRDPTMSGTVVRGIGFKHYAVNGTTYGMVVGNADRLTFENDTFAWSANMGISIFGSDCVFRGNRCLYNGGTGLNGYRAHRLLVEKNLFAYNNYERFSSGWGVAGTKILGSTGIDVRDNIAEYNFTKGIWMDGSIYDARIVRNVCRFNTVDGIMFELSSRSVIASNLLYGNGRCGLKVGAGSNHVEVYNNTFSRNQNHFRINGDTRRNTNPQEIALGITWDAGDITFRNNLMSNGDGTNLHGDSGIDSGFFHIRDYSGKASSAIVTSYDFNGYYRTSSATPRDLISWWGGSGYLYYQTIAAFRTATGFDAHSLAIDNVATNPFFVNEAAGDYHLVSGSPARLTGTPLSTRIASAIGVGAGVPVDMGALLWVTGTAPADTTAPVISGVAISGVSSSQATITWTTDEPADGQLDYGPTTAYGSSTVRSTTKSLSHSAQLTGLSPSTVYHVRVRSADAGGNLRIGADAALTTLAPADTTAPVISGIATSAISSSQATISWTTNEAADGQVDFGTTTAYGSSTVRSTMMSLTHTAQLTGLSASTIYHVRVRSTDAAGNLRISADLTVTTSAAVSTPIAVSTDGSTAVETGSESGGCGMGSGLACVAVLLLMSQAGMDRMRRGARDLQTAIAGN